MIVKNLYYLTKNTKFELYKYEIKFDRSFQDLAGFSKVFEHEELNYFNQTNLISKINIDRNKGIIQILFSSNKSKNENSIVTLKEFRELLGSIDGYHGSRVIFKGEYLEDDAEIVKVKDMIVDSFSRIMYVLSRKFEGKE